MTVSEAEAADTSRHSARPEQHGVPAAGGCGPTATPEDVDIPALREKYRLEREKRLR
ncbi:MAG: Cyclododecanone monooxygenase, partial [Mycobacterium sp.]|nr:Cyclododecanone monooxygenase [Mycobacterium sp.]